MTSAHCPHTHPRSILTVSGSPLGLENRVGSPHRMQRQATKLLNMARCQKGSGRSTACRLPNSSIRFPRGLESSFSAIKLPEPGGCHHRPVSWSPGLSGRRTAGHGSLERYHSAQAKTVLAVLRQSIRTNNLTPQNRKPTPTEANTNGGKHPAKQQSKTTATLPRLIVRWSPSHGRGNILPHTNRSALVPCPRPQQAGRHVPTSQYVGQGACPSTPTRHVVRLLLVEPRAHRADVSICIAVVGPIQTPYPYNQKPRAIKNHVQSKTTCNQRPRAIETPGACKRKLLTIFGAFRNLVNRLTKTGWPRTCRGHF